MSTYTQILNHIVFARKNRRHCLTVDRREELYRYIWGILKRKHCKAYRINGAEDHIHMLIDLHPAVALASLVKDIKVATSVWLRTERVFPEFEGWQIGPG